MNSSSLEEGKKYLKNIPGKITVILEDATKGVTKGIKTIFKIKFFVIIIIINKW